MTEFNKKEYLDNFGRVIFRVILALISTVFLILSINSTLEHSYTLEGFFLAVVILLLTTFFDNNSEFFMIFIYFLLWAGVMSALFSVIGYQDLITNWLLSLPVWMYFICALVTIVLTFQLDAILLDYIYNKKSSNNIRKKLELMASMSNVSLEKHPHQTSGNLKHAGITIVTSLLKEWSEFNKGEKKVLLQTQKLFQKSTLDATYFNQQLNYLLPSLINILKEKKLIVNNVSHSKSGAKQIERIDEVKTILVKKLAKENKRIEQILIDKSNKKLDEIEKFTNIKRLSQKETERNEKI